MDADGGELADATGSDSQGLADTQASASAPAPARKPHGSATIELRLRSPLRTAQVRFGRGKPVVVAPRAELTVPAGRPMLYWKPAEGDVWIEGKRFRLEAGRRYSIRLTTTGPLLE